MNSLNKSLKEFRQFKRDKNSITASSCNNKKLKISCGIERFSKSNDKCFGHMDKIL